MQVTKAAEAVNHGVPNPVQLAAINALAKAQLEPEQVYVFSLRLCDDQVDRDFERFDTMALPELARLFRGKTGIVDHCWSAENQVARIFETQVVQEEGVSYIKAWAYIRRGEDNDSLIADIEAGIKKEVSVGCAMGRAVCSICGSDYGSCGHQKGEHYDGQLCCGVLTHPTDAYEWSFVAVPAQRKAGVIKSARRLEDEARLGRKYLKELRRELVRLVGIAEPEADHALLERVADKLDEEELMGLTKLYRGKADRLLLPSVQLRYAPEEVPFSSDEPFRI